MGRRCIELPFSAATLPTAFPPDTVPSLTGLPSSVSFHSSNTAGIRTKRTSGWLLRAVFLFIFLFCFENETGVRPVRLEDRRKEHGAVRRPQHCHAAELPREGRAMGPTPLSPHVSLPLHYAAGTLLAPPPSPPIGTTKRGLTP